MFDEESYSEYAKFRIVVGWVFGVILGIVALVAGIICTIVSIKNNSGKELIGASVLLLGFGILLPLPSYYFWCIEKEITNRRIFLWMKSNTTK